MTESLGRTGKNPDTAPAVAAPNRSEQQHDNSRQEVKERVVVEKEQQVLHVITPGAKVQHGHHQRDQRQER